MELYVLVWNLYCDSVLHVAYCFQCFDILFKHHKLKQRRTWWGLCLYEAWRQLLKLHQKASNYCRPKRNLGWPQKLKAYIVLVFKVRYVSYFQMKSFTNIIFCHLAGLSDDVIKSLAHTKATPHSNLEARSLKFSEALWIVRPWAPCLAYA